VSWHPLMVAVLVLDALALLFAIVAGNTYVRVLLGFEAGAPTPRQIALEGATDAASVAGRYALLLFSCATLLLVVGISLVLPKLVAGAMCGTGVLTAMGGIGQRALALRGLALALLWVWRCLDALNRAAPRPPSTPAVARWQLLTLPLMALAIVDTTRALWALDPERPVDCCQVVYDRFASSSQATTTAGLADGTWLWLCAAGAVALLALALLGLRALRRPSAAGSAAGASRAPRLMAALLLLAIAWLPVAVVALVRVLSAYHYEVLHHHCPWCLLLPEHWAVGYPLYGALAVVLLEGLAALAAARFAPEVSDVAGATLAEATLAEAARRRQRRALLAIVVALLVFAALTAGPALQWRWVHGVWMHG
jgi:hypothetical protein